MGAGSLAAGARSQALSPRMTMCIYAHEDVLQLSVITRHPALHVEFVIKIDLGEGER